MRTRSVVASVLTVLASVALPAAAPRLAAAQTTPQDQAVAQSLYDEGKKLMAASQWSAACPKLEESQRLDPTPVTEFYLADCYERAGRTASAWTTFLDLAANEHKNGGSKGAAREKVARDRARSLEPKLSQLVIDVPAAARVAGLVVKRDGEAMREAQGGGDRPIGVTLPAGKAQPLRAVVRKLGRSTAGLLGARPDAVALYLADSRRPLETSEELLRRLFGLTAREASVLRALVEGGDTRGIARRLGIGAETVKTHLRHVMQAVGARRQAELIRLVLSSPAWIAATGASAATLPLQTRPARKVVRSPP